MNGVTVFHIKVHNKYNGEDFDEDLRQVLRRSGCMDEKICFILDKSDVMDSGFLERKNTLLANGEVPGLIEGDEHTTLMTQCKEGAQRQGLMLDTNGELYKWFNQQVMKNLHMVFTMNPSTDGLKDRAATSPALFNRCLLNWFGDWSHSAFFQTGREYTIRMDLDQPSYQAPDYFPVACPIVSLPPNHRDAVVNAMVFVHQSLYKCNAKIIRKGGHVMAITPSLARHFLDFIQHFVRHYNEERSRLEEEQLHINVGLNKIAETVAQVEEVQKSLAVKSAELENKNKEANEKLKQMVKDQEEVEKQKQQSIEISQLVDKQTKEITIKKAKVMKDLERVEPAVIDAQNVFKKQHLVEVRIMAIPPPLIKMALESVCILLGESSPTDWKGFRAVTMKEFFIPSIVNFNTDYITDDIRKIFARDNLSNPEYTYDRIYRANVACGPMVKWAIAQLENAEMLNRVDPLRHELRALEEAAVIKKNEASRMHELITTLEASINRCKEEYAGLISQAEAIKTTLMTVQDKVNRSMGLLQSLGIKKDRWGLTSDNFKLQMTTLIGDIFLSSDFLSYSGYQKKQELKQMVKDKQNAEDKVKEMVNDTSRKNVYVSALLLFRSGIELNPGPNFDMTQVQAASRKIWNNAGQLMDVPLEQCYTYEGMEDFLPHVSNLLKTILKNELRVPFQLKKYQEMTLQAMSRHKDVIVISPPGSGKTLSTYAGASLLRKLDSKPAGVVLHLVPYNSIIKDKVTNPWLPTGYIMMGGGTGTEEMVTKNRAAEDGDDEDVVTSDFTVQDLQDGKLSVVVCHPESLLSKKGDEVLKYLLRNDLLLSVIVDEFHKVIYWGCTEEEMTGKQKEAFSVAFRPGMKKVVRKLKSLTKNVPFVFETATLMEKEIKFALKTFSIKKPCIIKASPIQQQHCYLNLRRPDQGVPWEGDSDDDGNHISGLKDVIMELVLKPYIAMIKSEKPAHQKVMVFAKNRATLDKIDQELSVLLPEESRLRPDKSPWYLNHLRVHL